MLIETLSDFYESSGPERAGFVLTNDRVVEVKNVCGDPENGFEIDPTEILAVENDLVGVWHTHPGASSNLSVDDHDGMKNWPHLTHFIIGKDGVRAYRVEAGSIMIHEDHRSARLP